MLYREDEEEGIICSICRRELLWNSEFDYNDYGLDGDGIVGHYTCINKMCHVEDIQIFTK